MALPCTRCRSAIPGDARFCPQCGAAVPDRAAAPRAAAGGRGIEVCAGCGVIAPARLEVCGVCSAALGESRSWVEPRSDDFFWVAVRCRFQCRSCGHLSPLDHLDADGSVVCLRCGLDQVFDVDQWEDGIAHAHAVGDLSGPNAEGRFPNPRKPIAKNNPFKQIGVTKTSAELAQSGFTISDGMMKTRSLRVDASPGHPLCDHCRRPLTVQLVSDTHCTARCVPCGSEVGYDLPQRAADMNGSLKAVLAEELSVGRSQARVDQAGAGNAIGLRCPHCDAAMTITGTSQIVTCEFCHASSRIPGAALHSLGFADPKPLVWWMLFGGRSDQRLELETKHQPTPDPPISLPRFEREQSGQVERVAVENRAASRALSFWLPVLITAGIGWFAFGDRITSWQGAATTAVTETSDAPYVALRGCACKEPEVQLEVHVDEKGASSRPRFELGYRIAAFTRVRELASTGDSAPPRRWRERQLGIGVACAGDLLLVAADRAVTAWRIADGSHVWTAALPRPYRYKGDRADSGISIYCGQLSVTSKSVRVPTSADGETDVSLQDGKIRKR